MVSFGGKAERRKAFRLWFPIRNRRVTFDVLASSAIINILSLALPLALLQVYDRIIPNAAAETLVLLALGVACALLLELVLRACRNYVTGWLAARFEHAVGCRAIRHVLAAELTAFERVGSGEFIQRLNALRILREYYGGQAMQVVCDLPFSVLFIALVAWLAGWLALVPIAVFALFAASAAVTGLWTRRALDRRSQADDRRYNFLMEVLQGVHTVKALALENLMLRRYERLQAASAEAQHGVSFNSAAAQGMGAMFSQVTLFAVVGVGAVLVIGGSITVGVLAASTMLSSRAMQPLQRAVSVWARFQSIRLAEQRLQEVFDLPSEPGGWSVRPATVRGDIALETVSFRYEGATENVLTDVSLTVAANETVAIVGAGASGKSTLLHVMSGLLKPTAGTVRMDGRDLRHYDTGSLRGTIAFVPQHIDLFDGTLRENITMFRPELDRAALQVAEILGLDDHVARLPMGYDTRVGGGLAVGINQGVRQQIGLARVLVSRPRVILFDEANSALDRVHDALLQDLFRRLRGHWTLVMVTHRPSMLTVSDRVFKIADGRLSPATAPEAGAPLPLRVAV